MGPQMTSTVRSESFHVAGEQVAATLHEAHLALESYAEGDGGARALEQCAEALHVVRGVLQLLEIFGASLLAEEMEKTCAYLGSDSGIADNLANDRLDALSRAMVQLPAYIERVMGGGKDIPLVLLPLLNDLRAARGNPLLSESTLLLLNLEPGTPQRAGQPTRIPSGESIKELVARLRPQFQLGLLGWIKNGSSQQDLKRMASVAARLEQAASFEEVHQLWWVVGGVLEALLAGGLDAGVPLKRLIGQADREIKRLQSVGEADYVTEPPAELVNNLLYYVARARTGGPRCQAIREAFNIAGIEPGDEQVEEVRASLSAPSPKLMKTVADAIREDLAKAKDVLDIFVRTGMRNPADLHGQIGLLRKIGDTLGVLGLAELREMVQARSEQLEQIVSNEHAADEAGLIELAASLLEVEHRLDGDLLNLLHSQSDQDAEPDDHDFHAVIGAVMRECIVNLARIKDSIGQILAQPGNQAALDSVDEQLRGIGAGFMMLGKVRAMQVITRIGAALTGLVRRPGADISESANRLADAIVSLEYYMETLKAGRKEPAYMLDNAERSLEVLEADTPVVLPVEQAGSGTHTQTLQIDTAQLEQLPKPAETYEKTRVIDREATAYEKTRVIGEPSEYEKTRVIDQPATHEKTSVLDLPVLKTGADRVDPELLEIFIEEAREEIVSINRHFPAWIDNPMDDEALITVRRSFHTLKGSGRMVGASLMGEYAWSIENLLNRVISKTVGTGPALLRLLTDAVEALPQLLEQLEVGTPPVADLDGITAAAAVFASGGIPDVYEQAATADAASVAEVDDETAPAEIPVDEVFAEELLAESALAEAEVEVTQADEETPEIDPVLIDILSREAAGHLATVRNFLQAASNDDPPYPITNEMHRACHTLHGSITMANANAVATVTAPLYLLVERLFRSDTGMDPGEIQLCRMAADAIEGLIACLGTPEAAGPDTEELQVQLAEAAERHAEDHQQAEVIESDVDLDFPDTILPGEVPVATETPLPEPVDTQAPESLSIPGQTLPAPGAAIPPQEAGFDAEIAAIFSEEAAEILEAADVAIASLSANRANPAPLAELQRHLHTLKGGARMAGISAMGDFSHELESLLIRISLGGMGLDAAAFSLLQASIDELHRMRDQVATGRVSPPGQELADRLVQVVEATMVTPVLRIDKAPVQDQPAETRQDEAEPVDEIQEEDTGSDEDVQKIDVAETRKQRVLVPEPPRLGELARELISTPGTDSEFAGEDVSAGVPSPQIPDMQPRKEMARVDSAMLEDLLNNAGEISIFHSRLNQQMSSIQFNLEELGQTVRRLQQQLRTLEIETEAQILFRHQSDSKADEQFDPLELDRYSTIQQLSRGLSETASDVNSIRDLLQNIVGDTESILMQQARTTSELQDSLLRTRMVPFDQHVPRLSRLVRQQAIESGKKVELVIEGSAGELDRQVMEKMLPVLEHMLRNAVIHGIEPATVREEQGKPAGASIAIRFRREGAQVLIDVADDGAGLNLAAIRNKAIAQGVIRPDQQLTDEETAQLILQSGLSTADKLTQSAGRGIGMDVVVSEIAKLGGTLAIETTAGKGCKFTVRLPYTLAITQAFIVKVGPEIFALPLPTVEGVVRIARREFDDLLLQDKPVIEYAGRQYRLRHLGMYLGLGPASISPDETQIAVILVEAGENSTALIVDETTDNREIVVKPIGPQLASIRGIAGATILGDGRIVVILDPGSLVRSAIGSELVIRQPVVQELDLPPLALVVDDSITMRRVTQRLLERNGMRVITAKDGIEALEVLQEHKPQILILDIEMPRMDGYELAGRVRKNPEIADLPIIMVTSRTGAKHRARAIELGVNDYLGKPYQEFEMLDAIRHLLGEDFNVSERNREHDRIS